MLKEKPIIGKYILDTLSVGMYNEPMMLFREYIQNSVDSIDQLINKRKAQININIDGMRKIRDLIKEKVQSIL